MTIPDADVASVRAMVGLLTAPYRKGAETLTLALGADGAQGTAVLAYDFAEYRARHGSDPVTPRYVVILKQDLGSEPLPLEVDYAFQGAEATAACGFAAGAFAGTSVAVPLPAGADGSLQLLRIRQTGQPLPGAGADAFAVLTLLGNIAKLLWVLGWEKDQIRAHLRDVAAQRQLSRSHGASLDLLGEDLRVPRFPPREHFFDLDTIALYHLNERVADSDTVIDETVRFGLAGHSGSNRGAESLAVGKFGAAFRCPGPSGSGFILIPDDPAFALPQGTSFTVEMFTTVDAVTVADPRVLAVKGKLDGNGDLTDVGWALTVGSFRGIDNNVRWSVFDSAAVVEVFADLGIGGGRFHHVAGSLDGKRQRLRLFVDGVERASADASALGALTTAAEIHIGGSPLGQGLFGVIDEVRLSSVARSDFHPVLGEGDEPYRRRLGIFQRWILPTPGVLAETINGLVRIQGDPQSFILVEKDRPTTVAARAVRLVPEVLVAGEGIDADGNRLASEATACGLAEEDRDFDAIYLHTHDRPTRVDYGAEPDNARMQAATAAALDALIDRIAARQPPVAGKLVIDRAYDPAGAGLHRVGRAMALRHQSLPAGDLAALAHRAGFGFVRTDGTTVAAAVAVGEKLTVAIAPRPPADTPPTGTDVFVGNAIDLVVRPDSLPSAGELRWTLVRSGAGNGRFAAHPGDPATLKTPVATRRRLRLLADAPGELVVRVEYVFRRRIVEGTLHLRIGITSLADGATIAADGTTAVAEADAVGGVEATPINPVYLVTSAVAGINYGADPNNRKMQIGLERAFAALIAGTAGLATGLSVVKAFDPAAPATAGPHKTGRALILTHATVAADRLGALAHRAGFGFVRRQGSQIYASVAAGDRIEIATTAGLAPLPEELVIGQAVSLRARFDVLPAQGSFTWSLSRAGRGNGSFGFLLRPQTTFTPKAAGIAVLVLTYLETDVQATQPYTFEIRLKPALEAANAIIPKDSYDLIMNVLNAFHPIGVEVATEPIRKRVVEVEQDPLKAFPAYTYPDFRV